MINLIWIGICVVVIFFVGIRIVRPIEKGLVETLGKYSKTVEQGFHWVFPLIQRMIKVNVTEQMVDIPPQTIQTSDKLNMTVDAVVYYKVKDVHAAEYNVDGHRVQLTSLARTTLRAVMGKMSLTECIQNRDNINSNVETVLDKETDAYGVDVLRVEVQRIEPPQDVQDAMNEVVKAEQEMIAAKDFATAVETKADGEKRANIKKAEGISEGKRIVAEGEAKKIKLVNKAAEKYFTGNAQKLKQMDVTQKSLENNSKIIVTEKGINPQLIIGKLQTDK